MKKLLEQYRSIRNFDVESYIELKINAINAFFKESSLDSVVIGLSGGVDSTVAYYLLCLAARQKDSPIKLVVPIFAPIKNSVGTTGQDVAAKLITYIHCCDTVSEPIRTIDLSNASNAVDFAFDQSFATNSFVRGQMDYYLRPTIFYGVAAKLQSQGHSSVVCGTINRDEGSYIGYFGKKTDTCDIQIIGDLHKSEVYIVAEYLNCPHQIIEAIPSGGLHNGYSDVEEIGATYDMIELWTGFLILRQKDLMELSVDEHKMVTNIISKHQKNVHKYQRPLDCTFIDVIQRTLDSSCTWK